MNFFFILPLAASLLAADSIDALGKRWTVPIPADWQMENGELRLLVARPSEKPRRPSQYALLESPPFQKVTIDVEVQKRVRGETGEKASLIIVFGWRDENHFYYAHLSDDAAEKVNVHNGIFKVDGGDRVRMSPFEGPATLPDFGWHKVRLTHDPASGNVEVFVNGNTSPSLKVTNANAGGGRVGLGSFFDRANFRNFKTSGR